MIKFALLALLVIHATSGVVLPIIPEETICIRRGTYITRTLYPRLPRPRSVQVFLFDSEGNTHVVGESVCTTSVSLSVLRSNPEWFPGYEYDPINVVCFYDGIYIWYRVDPSDPDRSIYTSMAVYGLPSGPIEYSLTTPGINLPTSDRQCVDVPSSSVCYRITGNRCPDGMTCQNSSSFGPPECICEDGCTLNHGRCVDIDECALENSPCNLATHTCRNLAGSYECRLKPGQCDLATTTRVEGHGLEPWCNCTNPKWRFGDWANTTYCVPPIYEYRLVHNEQSVCGGETLMVKCRKPPLNSRQECTEMIPRMCFAVTENPIRRHPKVVEQRGLPFYRVNRSDSSTTLEIATIDKYLTQRSLTANLLTENPDCVVRVGRGSNVFLMAFRPVPDRQCDCSNNLQSRATPRAYTCMSSGNAPVVTVAAQLCAMVGLMFGQFFAR